MNEKQKNEILAVLLLAVCVLSLVSLISYDPYDVSFNTSSVNLNTSNLTGRIGAYFAWAMYLICGYSAYLVPALAAIWALGKFTSILKQKVYLKIFGTLILFIASSGLLSLVYSNNETLRIKAGGIAGLVFSGVLYRYFGPVGSYIITITLLILSLLLATEFLILPLLKTFFDKITSFKKGGMPNLETEKKTPLINLNGKIKEKPAAARKDEKGWLFNNKSAIPALKKGGIKINQAAKARANEPLIKSQPLTAGSGGNYNLPPIDLLKKSPSTPTEDSRQSLKNQAAILENTLADFGIEVKVVQIDKGPVVTRYELQPAAGVKVQRIVTLSDDIALSMKALSVRVVAPIPGKDRVGIEVPNSEMSVVNLREIITSEKFTIAKSTLTLALGKDIAGAPVVCDLGIMPHLLIAGTTGSGKTVCVNSIIISMLYRATPDELRFIMVDPKMVELAPYNGLPHLLCPVITSPKKVSAALNWTVTEMENRYQTFAREGARNIEIYNKKVEKDKKLPYIVVIIDELADLMVVASQEIENSITRLSQLSRAVGIHIILATQRPSVDVITGVIKANFPTRISFKVASKVDSRTVLDANGADKLIGRGDMLFLPPGTSKLTRAQAPLVSDEEIEKIAGYIKSQGTASYNEAILKEQERVSSSGARSLKKDELYDEAINVILESSHASVSMLQRRLGLGYTRAARLIDAMEAEGIVGPYRGSKPREIIVNAEDYLRNKEEE
ncbi:MAG: DNA translocase FtsK [Candidatus Omnitrophica bacterium]|nr:DNA translocase FtsK [Candidatus Omnitrophota bacterium]